MLYLVIKIIMCSTYLLNVQISHASMGHASVEHTSMEHASVLDENLKANIKTARQKIEDSKKFYEELIQEAKNTQAQYANSLPNSYQDNLADQILSNYQNRQDLKNQNNNIIVFVSFSMPDELLRSYHEQVNLHGGKMVIRGLYKNSFKKTIAKMKLDEKTQLILEINPKLFTKYEVSQVPVIVISKNDKFDKFTGSVSIPYAMEASVIEVPKNFISKSFERSKD